MENKGYLNSFEAISDYFNDAMRTLSRGLRSVVRSIFLDKGFSNEFCDDLDYYISKDVSFHDNLSPSDIYVSYKWDNLGLTLKKIEILSKSEIIAIVLDSDKIDYEIKEDFRKEKEIIKK